MRPTYFDSLHVTRGSAFRMAYRGLQRDVRVYRAVSSPEPAQDRNVLQELKSTVLSVVLILNVTVSL